MGRNPVCPARQQTQQQEKNKQTNSKNKKTCTWWGRNPVCPARQQKQQQQATRKQASSTNTKKTLHVMGENPVCPARQQKQQQEKNKQTSSTSNKKTCTKKTKCCLHPAYVKTGHNNNNNNVPATAWTPGTGISGTLQNNLNICKTKCTQRVILKMKFKKCRLRTHWVIFIIFFL